MRLSFIPALVAVSLLGSGGAPSAKPRLVRVLPAVPPPASTPFAVLGPPAAVGLAPPFVRCRPASGPPPSAPSSRLLASFSILRRAATSADALPAAAATALKERGFRIEGTGTARLLRTGPGDGKAWVVPVADASGFPCARRQQDEREGLAVVALGRTPVGGGGSREDLVRGRAPVSVESCTGPDGATSVSGIVPDGVNAVFLTATDGTAVRADVRDNGFALLVPALRVPEQRYLVWTPANGTPHVQPVALTAFPSRLCVRIRRASGSRVSPGPFSCVPGAQPFAMPPVPPLRMRARRRHLVPALPIPPVVPGTPGAGCP